MIHSLGSSYIRIFADEDPAPAGDVIDQDYMAETLRTLGDIAARYGVTLLAETNGVYADTAVLRELLDAVNHPNVAALWDVHHPYRYLGEKPEETIANLGDYIRYVHVKDSIMENGKVEYKLMGEGDLPGCT